MRIKRVTIEKLDTPVAVGDITVPKLHNFVSKAGCVLRQCDADPDGGHITTLLIGFFLRFMLPIVEDGRLWVAIPPLYVGKWAGGRVYGSTQEAVRALALKQGCKNPNVTYLKGLGEMQASELAETAMDPKTRHIIRIQADRESVRHVTALLGNEGLLRKEILGLI